MELKLTSYGGESRVIPAINDALLDQVLELSLGQDSVDKVNSTKVEDLDLWEAESFNEPLVLLVSGPVFVRSKGVCYTINVVNQGTSKIVHGVRLELVTTGISTFEL